MLLHHRGGGDRETLERLKEVAPRQGRHWWSFIYFKMTHFKGTFSGICTFFFFFYLFRKMLCDCGSSAPNSAGGQMNHTKTLKRPEKTITTTSFFTVSSHQLQFPENCGSKKTTKKTKKQEQILSHKHFGNHFGCFGPGTTVKDSGRRCGDRRVFSSW